MSPIAHKEEGDESKIIQMVEKKTGEVMNKDISTNQLIKNLDELFNNRQTSEEKPLVIKRSEIWFEKTKKETSQKSPSPIIIRQ